MKTFLELQHETALSVLHCMENSKWKEFSKALENRKESVNEESVNSEENKEKEEIQ